MRVRQERVEYLRTSRWVNEFSLTTLNKKELRRKRE